MIKKLHIKRGLTLTECGRRHEEEGLLSADQGDKWAIEPAAALMRICPACVRMVRNHLPPEAYGRQRVPHDDVAEGVRARFLTMVGEVS